jgi:hypothetical protein
MAWPVPTVPALAGWLAGQARWASFRPWAGDMAGAIAADRGRAVALLDPRPVSRRPFQSARCPVCGGDLTTVVYTPDDPRTSLIGCADGHEWEFGPDWQKLCRDIIRNSEAKAA